MPFPRTHTIAMETYAQRSSNYLERMVDRDGLPYFNIFLTDPAEAAHDWPDFGDVMSRQLQAAVMVRQMTGKRLNNEKVWLHKILSYINPQDGLLYRPATSYSQSVADPGDQALTLYALVTVYLDSPDMKLRNIIFKMVDGMLSRAEAAGDVYGFLGGFAIKSLMVCTRYMDYEPALRLAGRLVKQIFDDHPLFTPDNTFHQGGHMHGNLRCLVGAADYALFTNEVNLLSRIDALYRWVRSQATRFGFLPESIGRQGDVILCETCAIMDYLGLAVTLANAGHREYWGDVERMVRNHLIESQAADLSWLKIDSTRYDTDQFTWQEIDQRMLGGYAGWSSPNHFLAAKETLNMHWGGPELRDKTRLFQNCCGGSGTHAFYTAWKNTALFENGCLSVNLHLDKLLPQAEIRGFQPFQGRLTIQLFEDCQVRVCIPEFCHPAEMRVFSEGEEISGNLLNDSLILGNRNAGEFIEINYPLPIKTEEIYLGNPGFRLYKYRVTWKGDTVVKMEPVGIEAPTGYSDFDKRQVQLFYGNEGPGTLYQRQSFLEESVVQKSILHLDQDAVNFWMI
jgi:hypothetical protein